MFEVVEQITKAKFWGQKQNRVYKHFRFILNYLAVKVSPKLKFLAR
jgi:hypothetical protein